MDIEQKLEKLVNRLRKKWYSGTDEIFIKYKIESASTKQQEQITRLRELLELGYDVKTGYHCTAVRGYHQSFIAYNKKVHVT